MATEIINPIKTHWGELWRFSLSVLVKLSSALILLSSFRKRGVHSASNGNDCQEISLGVKLGQGV